MYPVYRNFELIFLLILYCEVQNTDILISGMETISFLIGGIFWVDADILSISMCGSSGWDHSDGERCFQSFCLQLVQ